MATINKKGAAFGGILLAVVVLLIGSHFIIAQDELARQYSSEQFRQTLCKPDGTCASGSVLDPSTGITPDSVTDLEVVSSEDSIVDQTADATQSPIFPGGSESMELVGVITKVDSLGGRTTEKVSIKLPTLSVVLDPATGVDISSGHIEAQLIIITDPLTQITTTGTFNYVLNGEVIESFTIMDTGRTNSDGEKVINEQTPVVFFFAEHINQFTEDGLSEVQLVIQDLVVDKVPQKYGVTNSVFYTAEFFKSDVVTKVTNEQGGTDIIFPIDDKIKICAQNSFVPFSTDAQTFGDPQSIPHPPMGDVKLTRPDGTSDIIFPAVEKGTCSSPTQCNSTCTFTDIARNSIYLLEYSDPLLMTSISTPFSQKNYYFSCWYTDETQSARNCSIMP